MKRKRDSDSAIPSCILAQHLTLHISDSIWKALLSYCPVDNILTCCLLSAVGKDYYKILGVPKDADDETLKKVCCYSQQLPPFMQAWWPSSKPGHNVVVLTNAASFCRRTGS